MDNLKVLLESYKLQLKYLKTQTCGFTESECNYIQGQESVLEQVIEDLEIMLKGQ